MAQVITCERCGRTTTDPDKWDAEADIGRILCDACWPHRNDDWEEHNERSKPARDLKKTPREQGL